MKKGWWILLSFSFTIVLIAGLTTSALTQEMPSKQVTIKVLKPKEWPIVETSGRLILEPRGKDERLVFHARDGQLYTVKGKFVEQLKDLVLKLGKDNIVSVVGKKGIPSSLSCHNTYSFDDKGNKKIETNCVRYYDLEVIKFFDAKQSNEELPPPKRDAEEERKTMTSELSNLQQQGMLQYVTIEGTIKSLNLRSPIKTVEVTCIDKKENKPLNKSLLISPNTHIAKKNIKTQEYMDLGVNSLEVGQKITVIYVWDERKSEALVITITREAK